jgi:hypothetical protein
MSTTMDMEEQQVFYYNNKKYRQKLNPELAASEEVTITNG